MYITTLWNTTDRYAMTFVMNIHTVSIFTKETPDSLLNSIDNAFITDLQEIEGAPECIAIISESEKKELIPCFQTVDMKKTYLATYEKFMKCMEGDNL